MTDDSMAFQRWLEHHGGEDFLRGLMERILGQLMEFEVASRIGAERHERNSERQTYRNGYRERPLHTRLGTLELQVPKLRQGTYFPSFLEPRRLTERALTAVIQEAWIGGMSTRKVDELVQALGMTGISKSQVSALCQDIDERVDSFLERPLEGEWPYLWLDATHLKVRKGGRVVSVAAIIASGVKPGRAAGNSGLGAGRLRSASVLGGFPAPLAPAGLERGPADHLRRP